ncbi:MAG TPA: cytochrome c3 family protein [Deltaproteobacteria bacterium]|nr:cytochrome c3 family protein [Deltaproteobacteria bacterium]
MRKPLKLVVVGVAMFFAVTAAYAATEVPDVVKLENKAYKKHTKGIVEFHHKKHAEAYAKDHPEFYKRGCGECHHDDQNKPLTNLKAGDDVKSCLECHKKLGEMPSKEKKAMRTAKLSKEERAKKELEYHAEAIHENCTGCHKLYNKKNKLKSKDPKAAPTTCKTCHPEK